jgi:uncharacterized LabA/DUF88 family protein
MLNTKTTNTRIYIDGANLHQGTKSQTDGLDYAKFYKYLDDKYHPDVIYIFMGKIEARQSLYDFLTECGYKIVFKDTFRNSEGEIKGNVDAEIVLKTVEESYELEYSCGILVSGDGDFSCLIDFWKRKGVKPKILAPNQNNCSYFLRRHNISLTYLDNPDIFARIKKDPQ